MYKAYFYLFIGLGVVGVALLCAGIGAVTAVWAMENVPTATPTVEPTATLEPTPIVTVTNTPDAIVTPADDFICAVEHVYVGYEDTPVYMIYYGISDQDCVDGVDILREEAQAEYEDVVAELNIVQEIPSDAVSYCVNYLDEYGFIVEVVSENEELALLICSVYTKEETSG